MPATFVRTLTVRSREEGAAEVARALHGVSDAYRAVVRTTEEGARVVDMTASKLARTEDGWSRLTGRLEGNVSAYKAFIRESTLAKQALDAGLTSVERYSDVIHQLRQELQAAGTTKLGFSVDQSGINGLLGVRANLAKSARDSASVFEEEARLMDGLQVKASRLRAELDPLGAAYERMNSQIAEHQQLADRQLISQDELAQATVRSRDAFDHVARSLKPVNDNVKLTSGQMQGLGYQINDIGTMLALGASPFQIMASQAGQVVQVLQDGPQGIKGSLKAIGANIAAFARSIPTAGYVVAGLSTAVAALWYATSGPDARSAADSIKGFEDAIKRLEGRWKGAADAARDYFAISKGRGDSPTAAFLDTGGELKKLKADLKATINDLDTSDALSGRILRPFSGAVSDARKEISSIYIELRKGKITSDEAAAALLRIRLDPNADAYARNFAEEIRLALPPIKELELRMQALNNARAQLAAPRGTKGRIDPVADEFASRYGDADTAMGEIREKLTKQKEELGKVDEAANRYTKTLADQRRSISDNVAGLQLQIDHFGETEGAMEAARFKADALAEAQRAAADAGKKNVDPELAAFIDQQATRYGELTDQVKALAEAEAQRKRLADFDADLAFERDQLGRTPVEQSVAERMRSAGLVYGSAADAGREALIRFNEMQKEVASQTDVMAEGFHDAFADLVDAIGQGDNAFDALISSFSRFGSQLASAGFDKIFGSLFGTAKGGGGIPAIQGGTGGLNIGKVASAASDTVIRAPLAALNDNLQKSATSALAVARQFDGLNEKANTGALDSFLRASGTWKNLSASDTAWCASFANASIIKAGGKGTGSNLASSFHGWGSATNAPQVGDIVVLKPQTKGASGHVGFVAGFGDGSVQVFGGNQRNGVNTKSFGLDQVAGYRTGFGVGEMTKAVSDGSVDAMKRAASGAVPGVQQKAQTNAAAGIDLNGMSSQLGAGMQALGAGLGIFSQGVQSQSPIGGALSGVLGGFQAGSTLGPLLGLAAGAGPIGAVIGGIVGLVGGIFGKSKAKKQAKKQKRDQARQAWDQNKTALRELQDHVNEVVRGSMSDDFMSIDENIAQFVALAKETKRSEDTKTVAKLQKDAAGYKARTKELFRDTFAPVTEDLAKGYGLDSEFVKARDGVKKIAESYRGFIGDVELAYEAPTARRDQILTAYERTKKDIEEAQKTKSEKNYDTNGRPLGTTTIIPGIGAADAKVKLEEAAKKRDDALAEYQRLYGDVLMSREEAIRKATEAAREGLLRIVSGDVPEQTDVEKALDQSRGAAASLGVQLTKLGMTAEEAGAAIDKALSDRLKLLKKDFEENLTSQINDLDGVGYLNNAKDLVKEYKDLMADAGRIGADTSLVSRYFRLSAQDIVDGAELTGTAFADLIKQFPELAGAVTEFGKVVKSEVVQEGLKSFYGDRLAEATQKRADAENELMSAYRDQADHLEGFSKQVKDFLTNIRIGDASPLSQKDQFLEAQRSFRDTQAKAMAGDKDAQEELVSVSQDYLDAAREYYASSEDYFASFNEVETSLKSADAKATSQLDLLKQQVGSLIDIDDGVKSVADAITALTAAIAAQKSLQDKVDGGRTFGVNTERNRLIDQGLSQLGLSYTGNYGFQQDGSDPFRAWRESLPADQLAAVIGVIQQYQGINRQMGGLIPGFAKGGIIGNGVWNKDSVLARYANGGSIALAGGEMVVRAPSVTPRTYPVLDAINRTGIVPTNDNANAGLVAEVRELRALVRTLIQTTGGGLQRVAEAQERTSAASEDMAATQRRKVA